MNECALYLQWNDPTMAVRFTVELVTESLAGSMPVTRTDTVKPEYFLKVIAPTIQVQ